MNERNIAAARRLYEEVYNQGNLDAIEEIYHPDFFAHGNSVSPEGIRGHQGLREFVTLIRTALPDAYFTIEDVLSDNDRVAVRWTMTGTLNGPLFGFPPNGKSGKVTGITIHRFLEGKAIEAWEEADMLGAFDQFGILPSIKN